MKIRKFTFYTLIFMVLNLGFIIGINLEKAKEIYEFKHLCDDFYHGKIFDSKLSFIVVCK